MINYIFLKKVFFGHVPGVLLLSFTPPHFNHILNTKLLVFLNMDTYDYNRSIQALDQQHYE